MSIEPATQKFFHQRHEHSTFTVQTADGEQTLGNHCGAFMGDSPAAVFFCTDLQKAYSEVARLSAR
eukprot:6564389-Pyramimonas_sp.AAC.1